jgi:hypothetical protein
MAQRLVDSAAARVALHRSAHSRGYKLSREGADPRSLLRGDVCVVVLVRCVRVFAPVSPPRWGPCLPFYIFQGEGSGYICGKRIKWRKDDRENKKGGLRCGRLPPYPTGAVSPVVQRATCIDLLASPSAGATCWGHASSRAPLCRRGRAVRVLGFA